MTTYEKYKNTGIDLSCVGFDEKGENIPYFCTPVGAHIIGRPGVDGIHFCFVPGYGDAVFAVSPMNGGEDCLHIVARTFEDFLRLLVACGDTAAIEQAWQWNKESFYQFLAEYPPTEEAKAVFARLAHSLGITPMENPYGYITELQRSFDYSALTFSEEYYDVTGLTPPDKEDRAWQVYFGSGFFDKDGRGEPGEEIPVNISFPWGDEKWHIPSLYFCGKGIVIDYCIEVNEDRLTAFIDRIKEIEKSGNELSHSERERYQEESPVNIDFRSKLICGGQALTQEGGCGLTYIPEKYIENGTNDKALKVVQHYQLKESKAYCLYRSYHRYSAGGKQEISSLELELEPRPKNIYCEKMENPQVGEEIEIVHPIRGERYTLSVIEAERCELDERTLYDEDVEYPRCYTQLRYRLSPQPEDRKFLLRDTEQNDAPTLKNIHNMGKSNLTGAAAIGIIGGADGPTAIILSSPASTDDSRTAISALRYSHAEKITWQPIFREKTRENIKIKLI